ncbi:hypothetical protein [Pseudomonas pharyngis]|uniref:hypothetical protein n=1 Tax=Pseudomonas pharyngis TaxID=2892333 RepID=UPI001F1824F8|nr:hypothetical protein [Pseudomonas pharyngis]
MPVKATNSADLTSQLNILAKKRNPSEFEMRLFRKEVEALKGVNADEYYMLLGMLDAVRGDLQSSVENHERALKLSKDPVDLMNYGLSMRRLGQFLKSQELMLLAFEQAPNSPETFNEVCLSLIFSGDFSIIDEAQNRFKRANPSFDLYDIDTYANILHIRECLAKSSIKESEYTKILSTLSNVLLKYNLSIEDLDVDLSSFDGVKHVSVFIRVYLDSPEKLFEINERLADEVISMEDLECWNRLILNVINYDSQDAVA